MSDESLINEAPAEAPAEESAPDAPAVEPTEGTEERPEWLASKFKSVQDQAKAYKELESRFGGFTGAPDGDYELSVPEGIGGEFDLKDPRLAWFQDSARKSGMSQDSFTELLHGFVQSEIDARPDPAAEIQSMGPDAQARLKAMEDWGRANLDAEQFEGFRGLVTSAAQAQAMEAVLTHTREAKIPRPTDPKSTESTAEDLRTMRYAKDEFGHLKMNDPAYRKKVDQAYEDLYGSGPTSQVAG
jgi:hypothetical protein